MSGNKNNEKRRYTRFAINQKVTIRLSNGELAKGQAINISLGGIYIEYGAAAEAG